jgi:hypothetical protein
MSSLSSALKDYDARNSDSLAYDSFLFGTLPQRWVWPIVTITITIFIIVTIMIEAKLVIGLTQVRERTVGLSLLWYHLSIYRAQCQTVLLPKGSPNSSSSSKRILQLKKYSQGGPFLS